MSRVVLSLLVGSVTLCHAAILYEVDFEAAGNSVGGPAAVSNHPAPVTPQDLPSRQYFGSSVVLDSHGSLTDQPLRFLPENVGSFDYSQLWFSTLGFAADPPGGRPFTSWAMTIDLILDDFMSDPVPATTSGEFDAFAILIDSPTSHAITFTRDNQITFNGGIIGSFVEGREYRYSFVNHIEDNRLVVLQDDVPIYDGIFHQPYPAAPDPPDAVTNYRLNLTDGRRHPNHPVAVIDNISITAVPEARSALLALAGLLLVLRRRRPLGS